ncbi:hypothetical protein V1511DRAFT_508652 [Dipodascopsis uninucleata]
MNSTRTGPKIILTEQESKIRSLLVEAAKFMDHIDRDKECKLELRVTGGWVRDKLLGHESNDLDIAVNRMTGAVFAKRLQAHINANTDRLGLRPQQVHTIALNPEKSKHLETATTKVYDVDVDFVNLRSEEYTESSRIPIVRFGTPKEDALRRDATINAIFYNLTTEKVEDFTEMGLKDLNRGIIRTPLDPFATFKDDPLRILRLIRFASRFNFIIEEHVKMAMKDEAIKKALAVKISRERIGVEIEKILKGPDPLLGLSLIEETGLFNFVFYPPLDRLDQGQGPQSSLIQGISALRYILDKPEVSILTANELNDRSAMLQVYLFISVVPWKDLKCRNANKKMSEAVSIVIIDGLKLSSSVGTSVAKIVNSLDLIQSIMESEATWSRKQIGLMIRDCGNTWKYTMFCAMIFELQKHVDDAGTISNKSAQLVIKGFKRLYQYIISNELSDVANLKPILDGNQLQSLFGLKAGRWMRLAIEDVIEWQIENPLSSAGDCREYMLTLKDTYVRMQVSKGGTGNGLK